MLHRFPSKEAIYQEVSTALTEWMGRVEVATEATTRRGWVQVDRVVAAGFGFFREAPDFVIAREAGRDSALGVKHLGVALRPFSSGRSTTSPAMGAGTFRKFNPEQLLLTGYGALLSYFGDLPFIEGHSMRTRWRRPC